jgi:DNA-binding MarR family transcriptional regulator
MTKHTQCTKLLKALTRKRGVTSLEAAIDLSITSIHRRLADLREMGVEYIKRPFVTQDGARCLRYHATKVPAHLMSQAKRSDVDLFLDGVEAIVRGVSRKARG